jgi:hypothetical protein
MALMVAIGELQKQMGPDQRISANSAILDASKVNHAHWLGVWNSWKAGIGEASQHSTIQGVTDNMAPTYLPNRSDYFRKWLVSLNEDEMSSITSPKTLSLSASPMPGSDDDAVFLVADGSLGTSKDKIPDYVAARILDIKDKETSEVTGRYSWWIGDESQKARIMDDSYLPTPTSPPLTSAEKIYRSAAPGSMGTKTFSGLEKVTDDSQFAALPSLATLDLVTGATDRPAQQNFHTATPFSYSVLTDVREGGLKRDLSVILEQPIDLANQGPEYMLYEFDDARFPYLNNPNDARRANSRVPIQDLAAYYQLYDHEAAFANGRREGVQYTSTGLPNSLQIRVPDHDGGSKNRQRLVREYTSLYRQPVITKVQFLVGVTAQPITQADRDKVLFDMVNHSSARVRNNLKPIRDSDTHKLRLGITPMVTLWNPSNLPLVMDAAQILRYNSPPFGLRWRKYRPGGNVVDSYWFNLGYTADPGTGSTGGQASGFSMLRLFFSKNPSRIVFQPGEVKVFSLPATTAANLKDDAGSSLQLSTEGTNLNTVNSWDPFGVFLMRNSAPSGHYSDAAPEAYSFAGNQPGQSLVFSANDRISLSIDTENEQNVLNYLDGRVSSSSAEIKGSAFSLYMLDEGYQLNWRDAIDSLRHNIMISRHGTGNAANKVALGGFYRQLMLPGFPGEAPIAFDGETNAIPGSQIIGASNADEIIAVMDFSLSLGSETASAAAGGFGGGRRITSRPFLHSAIGAMPYITESDKASLYDYGWDWQIGEINTVEDSILQAKPGTGNGYYGGGYTLENGTTHVIQSEIPVLPPISIAALSHAHLGGFSLANAIPVGENPDTDKYWFKSTECSSPTGVAYQRVTASGQNGLAPHIVQAIGNSYAHPNIPANKSFVTKQRTFDIDHGAFSIPYVDHSYLANKALWDEYFFSSISPQPSKVELFGSNSRTAKQLANEFYFGSVSTPLPNRRILPYKSNLDQSKLDTLFTQANIFSNGLADKIASHLMVDGAFNVNSTSVDAWRVLFSSLRGKPFAYLESGKTPLESTSADKTAVNSVMLPNAKPVSNGAISSSNNPKEQWIAGRELSDTEITELAVAMVKQVRLRGPFLSMSEFINRRLDDKNSNDMALKGALQAALDDPSVSINAQFRTPVRTLDTEVAGIGFAFPEAAKGSVAYGSQPYIDQADVLRGFAEQLTPRGDTFIIRTYGDSLDAKGKVVARAWCEAVVQRVPEYMNSADAPHLKQADSSLSAQSKQFGRKMQIVSFRWINPSEI